jgi:nucleoside-diphosphate-sugar epimerase
MDLLQAGHRDLRRLCAGARVVVNASGAVWDGTEQEMTALNADLAGRLTEAVAGLTEAPRVIHLGSAYEYGPVPDGTSIGEDRPPAPATPYGRTKLLGTRAVVRAALEDGVDAVVLRVSVACGPGTPRVSLPGIVVEHLLAGRAELRLAPLRAHRDFVDVRDVADAVLAAARAPRRVAAGAVINVGSGQAVPVRRLVDLMISLSGRALSVVEESSARRSRSDAQWQRLDIGRARSLLGWEPRRPLEGSLRDLLASAGVPGARSGTTETGERLAPLAGASTYGEGLGKDRR